MFNVIRVPTKFSRTIKRFSQIEKSELLDMLIEIWSGYSVTPPDTIVWDTFSLIYWEWMNMESKNGNKPKKSLIEYSSEWVAEPCPSESTPRVEYSRVEESRVEDNKLVVSWEIIETKVSTLEAHINNSFTNDFIWEVYKKYSLKKEDFQEECKDFLLYWKEKSPKWKKERWEKEKTFDPKLRFRTWMKNNKRWSNRVVVNSEDEDRKNKLEEIERKKKLLFNKI